MVEDGVETSGLIVFREIHKILVREREVFYTSGVFREIPKPREREARLGLVTIKAAMFVSQRRLMAFRTTRSTFCSPKVFTFIWGNCKNYSLRMNRFLI